MAPVSSEGNPVDEDIPQKGDMQVLEEHRGRGRRLSAPHLSPAIPQFPTRWCRENGLRLPPSAPHPRRMVLDLDLPKARSHVRSAPFIPQKCGLSLVVGHWPKDRSLPKCHPVALRVCLYKVVLVLSAVSTPPVSKSVWLKQMRPIP